MSPIGVMNGSATSQPPRFAPRSATTSPAPRSLRSVVPDASRKGSPTEQPLVDNGPAPPLAPAPLPPAPSPATPGLPAAVTGAPEAAPARPGAPALEGLS